jgi:cysteinyl-tRNA synthetase
MAMRYLGETFDLHGAGLDNLFPHNEDEIAQSECCTDKPFARYWVHNGSLTIDGVKMSKSLGNFVSIRDALAKYPAPLIRYFLVSSHYRAKLDYSEGLIEDARKGWERLRTALENAEKAADLPGAEDAAMSGELSEAARTGEEEFRAAMDDDFNSPAALAALFTLATEVNRVTSAGTKPGGGAGLREAIDTFRRLSENVLGLTWPERETSVGDSLTPQLIQLLLDFRQQARENRDWKTSDAIRDRLKALGVLLEDRVGGGTDWKLQS